MAGTDNITVSLRFRLDAPGTSPRVDVAPPVTTCFSLKLHEDERTVGELVH